MTIPALNAIRRHFGIDADIWMLHEIRQGVETTPVDLLGNSSVINRFINYRLESKFTKKLFVVLRLWWKIRSNRFQSVVYLMPSERTSQQLNRDVRFFKYCGISNLIGFRSFPQDILYPIDANNRPGIVKHEALCRLERLRLDGIDISQEVDLRKPFLKIPPVNLITAMKWLKLNRKHPTKSLIAICPGSKQPANLWPAEYFIEIGHRLIKTDKYELIIVGGPAERYVGSKMIDAWGSGINAAGAFTVLETAALLSQCAFSIGLDTGTTHLAAAQGTKCIALYGERDNQGRFEPLGNGHIVLRNKVACAGCRVIEKPCPIPNHPCMSGLRVNLVWDAIEKMQSAG